MCGVIESVIEPPPQLPPHPQRPNYKSMQTLNMKIEANRRKTYKERHVPFMEKITLRLMEFTLQTVAM
jgi:hypothetical protein